jgi:glycosyltransferase involved in cell wall biosynthesis
MAREVLTNGGSERLKVLFITGAYPEKDNPMANVFVREHAKAVSAYDQVQVLHWAGVDGALKRTWRVEIEKDQALTQGIVTYRLWRRPSPLPRLSLLLYLWSVLRAFQKIKKDGFSPNIIHAHVYVSGVAAAIIGKLFKIPVAVTEHWSIFPRKALERSEIVKARFAFQSAGAVLPVSRSLQKAIEECGIKANFHIVPNAVDMSLFSPSGRRGNGVKQIIYVGNLIPTKGIPEILEILAGIKDRGDWQMHIFGQGPMEKDCKEIAAASGIKDKIVFHGFQPKSAIAPLMRECDFMLHPSLGETFGTSIVEAMACGLPVVAFDVGALRDTVSEERGILVPLGDKVALQKAVELMLDRCRDYSRDRISRYANENFSYAAVGKKLHDIYSQLIRNGKISERRNY